MPARKRGTERTARLERPPERKTTRKYFPMTAAAATAAATVPPCARSLRHWSRRPKSLWRRHETAVCAVLLPRIHAGRRARQPVAVRSAGLRIGEGIRTQVYYVCASAAYWYRVLIYIYDRR